MTDRPLIIKDWQNAIGDSPHLGFGLLQNVEIDTFPGAIRVGKQPVTAFPAAISDTFTVNTGTDICTLATATAPNTGTAITFTTSNTLPNPLVVGTTYFVINVSANTFKVAVSLANALAGTPIVDFTTTGTGTQTVATVNAGTIRHYAFDSRTSTKFIIDSNGLVWFTNSTVYQLLYGNTLTNASGNGLAVFRVSDGTATYLFVYRNGFVDVVNVFGTSDKTNPNWTNGWKALNTAGGTANSHHSIVGQDNIIYFTDDRYVGSIQEKPGQVFDPSNLATYTFNNQALTLPLGSLAYWLEQLGINLLTSVSNDAYVYPWDRSSVSFGLPLPIGDFGVNKMKNIGNIVYILAGTRGNIYYTQGTYVKPFKTLSQFLTNNSTTPTATDLTWGGIAAVSGKLIVGVGAASGKSGVYMINSDGGMTIDNFPSTGQQNVTALFAQNEFYDMGYAGGADMMGTTRYSSLGSVIVQSPFYRIGNATQFTKYSTAEVQIANPVTGSIRIGWRSDLTSAFTNIPATPGGSTTTITLDGVSTGYTIENLSMITLQNIQIQAELAGNIDLMEVRLFP